ncbi:hypothetical protein MC885_016678, partial [Smutsia gigantea]
MALSALAAPPCGFERPVLQPPCLAGEAGFLPGPAFPPVLGTYLNVLDRTLPFPEPSGSPLASSLAAATASLRGPESA